MRKEESGSKGDSNPTRTMSQAGSASSGLRRLNLADVYLHNHSPGGRECQTEHIYQYNYQPSCSSSTAAIGTVRGVDNAHRYHAACHDYSTENGGSATAPAICKEESRDSNGKHQQGRDA